MLEPGVTVGTWPNSILRIKQQDFGSSNVGRFFVHGCFDPLFNFFDGLSQVRFDCYEFCQYLVGASEASCRNKLTNRRQAAQIPISIGLVLQ